MKLPANIHFLGHAPNPAVEAAIRARIAQLEQECPDVMAWRVTVAQETHRHVPGRLFSVRVDVTLPRHELVVSRVHDGDVHVAVREAFDAMEQKLLETNRIRRGEIKHHGGAGQEAPQTGGAA